MKSKHQSTRPRIAKVSKKGGTSGAASFDDPTCREAQGGISQSESHSSFATKRVSIARTNLESEVIKAVEQEKMRIGNDLHDGIGQMLTGILSLTEALESELQGITRKEAGRIRELVRDTIQQVRALSHGLSSASVLHRGLVASLRQLARNTCHAGLKCEFKCSRAPKFKGKEAWVNLFRIAQESVSNAIKHGRPKCIIILLQRKSDHQGLMLIQDDGKGMKHCKTKKSEGVGIPVIQHRINLLGGKLAIKSRAGGGTVVSCHFPCGF